MVQFALGGCSGRPRGDPRTGGLGHFITADDQYLSCFHIGVVGPTRRPFFAEAFSLEEVTCGSVRSQGFPVGVRLGSQGRASSTDSVSEPPGIVTLTKYIRDGMVKHAANLKDLKVSLKV